MQGFWLIFAVSFALIVPPIGFYVLNHKAFSIIQDTLNNVPRNIDLLGLTYAQQSIIGSGGYMPEDVYDVQKLFSCGKWDLEKSDYTRISIRRIGDGNQNGSRCRTFGKRNNKNVRNPEGLDSYFENAYNKVSF